MRSCVLLGSPSSGAGMLAAALRSSGYSTELSATPPSRRNPFGSFAPTKLGALNDELLAPSLTPQSGGPDRAHHARPWLSLPPAGVAPVMPAGIAARAQQLIARGPWCLRDPRLAFTLPAWSPLLGDAARIVVFRDPARTAASLVASSAGAVDREHALALWAATYRALIEQQSADASWHFIHQDQLFAGSVTAVLARVLGTRLETSSFDACMQFEPPASDPSEHHALPPDVEALYAELCQLAAHATGPSAAPAQAALPAVDLIAILTDADADRLPELLEDRALQRGVNARLIVVDATWRGDLARDQAEHERCTIVRCASLTQGSRYAAALDHVEAPYVALASAGCRSLPTRLAHAIAALESGAQAVTCDYFLTDPIEDCVDRSSPATMGLDPGPFWSAGLCLRTAALHAIARTAFLPVELELYRRLAQSGALAHVTRPGFCASQERYAAAFPRSRTNAALATLMNSKRAAPRVSVALAVPRNVTADELRDTLEGLTRQTLAPGSLEVLLAAASTPGSASELPFDPSELDVNHTLRVVSAPSGSLAALHNAALAAANGEHVLFTVAGSTPEPDLVERHLQAHAAASSARACVGSHSEPAFLGTPEQPGFTPAPLLAQVLRSAPPLEGAQAAGEAFFDARNASAPRELLRSIGGFDESLGARADVELGLRLKTAGCALVALPQARTTHSAPPTTARLRAAAWDSARLASELGLRQPALRWSETLERLAPGLPADPSESVLRAHVLATRERRAVLEDALDELARIDVEHIASLGGAYAGVAADLRRGTEAVLSELTPLWRYAGALEGLRTVHPAPPTLPGAAPASSAPIARPQPVPELSVIIPTHNRHAELTRLLAALGRQDLERQRFEVLVVDDGSDLPVADCLAPGSVAFELKLLRQAPGGPGKARNFAAAQARGASILLLNDDAVPHPGLLRGHLDAQRFAVEPRAVLGTFTLLPKHNKHSISAYVESTTSLFAQPAMRAGVHYDGMSFCSGNVSLPRSALVAVGGFDEALPYAGGEDTELGLRLEQAQGLRVAYDPTLRCEHDHDLDVHSILRRKRVMGWVIHRIQEKHGDLGLLPLASWPPSASDWELVRREVSGKAADFARLEREIAVLCEKEAATRSGAAALQRIAPVMGELERLATLRGALMASRGELPLDAQAPAISA